MIGGETDKITYEKDNIDSANRIINSNTTKN